MGAGAHMLRTDLDADRTALEAFDAVRPRRASWEASSLCAASRIEPFDHAGRHLAATTVASSRARRASLPLVLHQPRDLPAAFSSVAKLPGASKGASKLPGASKGTSKLSGASKPPGAWMDNPSSVSKAQSSQSASWTRGRVPRDDNRAPANHLTTPAATRLHLAAVASSRLLVPSKDTLRPAR